MSWFSKLFKSKPQVTKSANQPIRIVGDRAFYPDDLINQLGRNGLGLRDYYGYLLHGYARNPYVGSAVNLITNTAATIPIQASSDDEVDGSFDFSEYLSHEQYIKVLINLLITGNAYLLKIRPDEDMSVIARLAGRNDSFTGLRVMYTPQVTINTVDGREYSKVLGYTYRDAAQIPAEDVIHIKFCNPVEDDHYGLSPLSKAETAFQASNNILAGEAFMHKNMGAQGVLSPKTSEYASDEDELRRIQKSLNERSAGVQNFGQITASTTAVEYVSTAKSPKDLMSVEGDTAKKGTIAACYNISPILIGDTSASTYDNYQTAREAMYEQAIFPLMELVNNALESDLLPEIDREGQKLVIDKSGIEALNKTDKTLSEKYAIDIQNGVITSEQVHDLLYPDLPFIAPATPESQPTGNQDE